jgi:hypothetical protein
MDDAHHVLCDANHCRKNGANYQNPELSHHQFSFNNLLIVNALRGTGIKSNLALLKRKL